MSIGLVIVAYFVKKLRIRRTAMIISSITLLVVLFLFNSNASILSDTNSKIFDTQTISVKSNNLLSNIKESIKSIPSSMFGETQEVDSRISCDAISFFDFMDAEDISKKMIRIECEDACPTKTTKYSGSYRCDATSGTVMCSCRDTPETSKFKQDCQNLCKSNKLCEYAGQEEGTVSFQQKDGKLCSCDCVSSKQSKDLDKECNDLCMKQDDKCKLTDEDVSSLKKPGFDFMVPRGFQISNGHGEKCVCHCVGEYGHILDGGLIRETEP